MMRGAPERKKGEDGLPVPPYRVYNIGGGQPENLLDYVGTLQRSWCGRGCCRRTTISRGTGSWCPCSGGRARDLCGQ